MLTGNSHRKQTEREQTQSQCLDNATELVAALEMKAYNVSLRTFGDQKMQQEVEAVQDASVLMGVTLCQRQIWFFSLLFFATVVSIV